MAPCPSYFPWSLLGPQHSLTLEPLLPSMHLGVCFGVPTALCIPLHYQDPQSPLTLFAVPSAPWPWSETGQLPGEDSHVRPSLGVCISHEETWAQRGELTSLRPSFKPKLLAHSLTLLFHNGPQIHCNNTLTPRSTVKSSTLQHPGKEGTWPNLCYKQVFIKGDKERQERELVSPLPAAVGCPRGWESPLLHP